LLLPVVVSPQQNNDDPNVLHNENSASADDNDGVLVVLVQEWDYVIVDASGRSSNPTNTTVLVYHRSDNQADDSTDEFKLVQRFSLSGGYDRAYQGQHVHVVTTTILHIDALTDTLTPAFLQTNSTSWRNGNAAPKLLLNETQYRKLAYAQFERSVDTTVRQLAAGSNPIFPGANEEPLDCTGFVTLSHLRSNDTNVDVIESRLFDDCVVTQSKYAHGDH
jgi:hypothetical protein